MTTWRAWLCGVLAASVVGAMVPAAEAGILTKILREAGDAGKKAGKAGDLDLPDGLGSVLARLPDGDRSRSLAVETTPEGHLRLTNAAGEKMTVASTGEVNAALRNLLPDASDVGRKNVDFYVPSSALTRHREALNNLPPEARVRVAHKSESYSLLGSPPFAAGPVHVRLRDNLVVKVDNDSALSEAVWQMRRSVNQSSLRVMTLDPKATGAVPRVRTNTGGKSLPPEAINPYALAKDLGNLRGQTVLLTGKIDGELLFFTPPSGKTQSVLLSDIRKAALRDDVNLIVLNANDARQPGVRNLLWQRAQVDGLAQALEKATMGDFLGALAEKRGTLELSVAPNGATHVAMKVVPKPQLSRQMPDSDGSVLSTTERIFSELVANVSGDVVTSGIEASFRSEAREKELSHRIVPGIPSDIQIIYIFAFVVGLMGLPTIITWWRKLWPVRDRASFGSTLGMIGNRIARFFPFAFLFMPLVAFIATPYQMLVRPLELITAPFRWLFRQFRAA